MSGLTGRVYLVGAGPGDPGLMTRRSLELIAAADAILHDRLIPSGALDGARADADLRYVGKDPHGHSTSQATIEEQLVELAREGRTVVRLKGGDPFVFGRGGEEAQALVAAGVPFEVVPGVSAGVAAPAYAGIPVTHREDSSAVAFVTGHEDPGKPGSSMDWPALAVFPGTLVIYMGAGSLAANCAALVEAGRPASEPVAVIERGTLPAQRTIAGTLENIAARAADAGLRPPAVTVIGAVAALGAELGWIEHRALFGRRVVVTRARAQASALAARLEALGAEVVEAPAIRILARPVTGDLAAAIDAVGRYSLVCVTSPSGAGLLLAALRARGRDARSLAGATVAAIGPGTAAELARGGIVADVVPERSVAEGLVEALADVAVEGHSVLVARAAEARDVLPAALSERGARVDVADLYETVAEDLSETELDAAMAADYLTFTSSSTVRFFLEAMAGSDPQFGRRESNRDTSARPRVVSIGPVTSATAREAGLEVHVEAARHDIDGLIDALVSDSTR